VLPAVLSMNVQVMGIGVLALAATAAAVTIFLRSTARFLLAGPYAFAWLLLAMAQLARGATPGTYYLWTGLAEWAGLLLVAAIVGWLIGRPRLEAEFRNPVRDGRWFMVAQALLMAVVAALAGWIAIDFSFDGIGAGSALFGFAGRSCACPVALMLLGASIVMAWQSNGGWRAAWQFTAMAAGILLTSSIGWVRIDAASKAPWFERWVVLMISTGMMAMMTWVGLSRGLPKKSDWIHRGRQASPYFGSAALLLLAIVLIERVLTGR
jgi:hypothetical protein